MKWCKILPLVSTCRDCKKVSTFSVLSLPVGATICSPRVELKKVRERKNPESLEEDRTRTWTKKDVKEERTCLQRG